MSGVGDDHSHAERKFGLDSHRTSPADEKQKLKILVLSVFSG